MLNLKKWTLVSVVALSGRGALARPSIEFRYGGSSFTQTNAPATSIAMNQIVQAGGLRGSFTSPDGTETVVLGRDGGATPAVGYNDFDAFKSANAAAGNWSLNIFNDGGNPNSNYTFKADFSGISASIIPKIQITSPLANESINETRPTIHWSQTGDLVGTVVQVSNADFSVDYNMLLPPDETSFTVPADLPAGDYTVFLTASMTATTVPMNLTLVSGADDHLSPQGTMIFAADALEAFTVVPEPGSAVFSLAVFGVSLSRRWSRAIGAR